MQTQNRILDDMAKVASSAMGAAAGMRGEIEARVREQFERILSQMDVVPREEFEAMKAVAIKAREVGEDLADKVAALEARLSEIEAAAKPAAATVKKTATKATVKSDKAES
ncbi:accessory factor UbiK family protein [Kiloniella laminariae]|uniref:accessory factor UbiK family protein n=1 Tax=Kiloniella laminariae TaxID=454162 RepID=UPI00039A33AB|nr:accessory factor UbiK family protein [Kiloniella laminariae]